MNCGVNKFSSRVLLFEKSQFYFRLEITVITTDITTKLFKVSTLLSCRTGLKLQIPVLMWFYYNRSGNKLLPNEHERNRKNVDRNIEQWLMWKNFLVTRVTNYYIQLRRGTCNFTYRVSLKILTPLLLLHPPKPFFEGFTQAYTANIYNTYILIEPKVLTLICSLNASEVQNWLKYWKNF